MIRFRTSLVVLTLLGCSSLDAGSTDAENTEQSLATGTYTFGTLASPGKCMDVDAAGSADGTNIQQWQCNGTGAQSFRVEDLGGGALRLVNTPTGKCVDVAGKRDGSNVRLWTCNGSAAQSFRIIDAGSGNVQIKNNRSRKCVDVASGGTADGTNIQVWSCTGTSAQLFHPTVASTTPIPDPDPTPDPDPIPDPDPTPTPTTKVLCSEATPYRNCQATDFAKEDIFGNAKWQITTWGNENRRHSTDNLWVRDGALVMKVNGGTPAGQQTVGAEIISTKNNFLYGSFRTMAKTASEPGTVNSPLFYYLSDQSEIDVEILSIQNSRRLVNYTIHENTLGPLTHQVFDLGFDPSAGFHEYRFDWSPSGVTYYVDGKHTLTLTGNVPTDPGAIMLNHWTLSDPGWGGGPPINDAFMYVKYIEIYYN